MKKIKLLFNSNNLSEKLKLIKLIKDVFSLGLKEAKDFVDSGEMIPECLCDDKEISFLRSYENLGLKVIILDDDIKRAQMVVQQYTEFILLRKEKHKELLRYKALYLDLIGSIESLSKDFRAEESLDN